MNSLKSTALHRLALHCGYRSDSTKAARLEAIAQSAAFFNSLPQNDLNVLSVDVGIKHFSYSKISYSNGVAALNEWRVLNLHDAFGSPNHASLDLTESKAYLAHLAVSVVDSIFISPHWKPSIITIENQRTRSNTNKVTLPNVLLNFSLEHMLYAAFAARQSTVESVAQTTVIPMNSNKMVNFWLSRFVAKTSKIPPAKSKAYRIKLLYSWLSQPAMSPFDLSSVSKTLPDDFGKLSATKKKLAIQESLGLSGPQKMDDLVDSFLYNLTIAKQLEHHNLLQKYQDDEETMLQLLDQWDDDHKRYLTGLADETGLVLE